MVWKRSESLSPNLKTGGRSYINAQFWLQIGLNTWMSQNANLQLQGYSHMQTSV